jgi:tyrosyl-tRNA synthetase
VQSNVTTYLDQVYKILDPQKTEVRYNSEWLGKMTGEDMIRLCSHYRLARMLEREDFRSRMANNQPLSIHELMYPLLVAYDSVVLEADVELGATEQKFNLLIGRDIQREYGQPSQVALTMPILVGLDGERKMSKSLGNYVGITESPREMFGKLMSISDELMWSYYELLTDFAPSVIVRLREEVRIGVLHPMDAKMQLAHIIIAGFHGEAEAKSALDEFQRVFRDRLAPAEIPQKKLPAGIRAITALLAETGLVASRSEAERLIMQHAVELNGILVNDVRTAVDLVAGGSVRLRVGKRRFLEILAE